MQGICKKEFSYRLKSGSVVTVFKGIRCQIPEGLEVEGMDVVEGGYFLPDEKDLDDEKPAPILKSNLENPPAEKPEDNPGLKTAITKDHLIQICELCGVDIKPDESREQIEQSLIALLDLPDADEEEEESTAKETYMALSKEQLIDLLEAQELAFKPKMNKEEMVAILIEANK